jgi:hypothetical protein
MSKGRFRLFIKPDEKSTHQGFARIDYRLNINSRQHFCMMAGTDLCGREMELRHRKSKSRRIGGADLEGVEVVNYGGLSRHQPLVNSLDLGCSPPPAALGRD